MIPTAAISSPAAKRPNSGFTFRGLLVAIAVVTAVLLVTVVVVVNIAFSPPVERGDAHHLLVFKPGRTIPSRSLDAEEVGAQFHFTRYDVYKAPDWHARKK